MAKFCTNCGKEVNETDNVCSNCGTNLNGNNQNFNQNNNGSKSKIAAGILGILLGSLGVHNFYLGYTNKAIGQLLLTLVRWIACGLGPIAAGIWGLIEGIMILCGNITTDANGNILSD